MSKTKEKTAPKEPKAKKAFNQEEITKVVGHVMNQLQASYHENGTMFDHDRIKENVQENTNEDVNFHAGIAYTDKPHVRIVVALDYENGQICTGTYDEREEQKISVTWN